MLVKPERPAAVGPPNPFSQQGDDEDENEDNDGTESSPDGGEQSVRAGVVLLSKQPAS